MSADFYLWVKALHISAAMTFVGGILAVRLFLATVEDAGDLSPAQVLAVRRVRGWDKNVTTPAMLAVWLLGLTLAVQGGWFPSLWLGAKLILVLALSGLHGIQSGALRRLAGSQLPPKAPSATVAPLVVVAVVLIALLAVLKPSVGSEHMVPGLTAAAVTTGEKDNGGH